MVSVLRETAWDVSLSVPTWCIPDIIGAEAGLKQLTSRAGRTPREIWTVKLVGMNWYFTISCFIEPRGGTCHDCTTHIHIRLALTHISLSDSARVHLV